MKKIVIRLFSLFWLSISIFGCIDNRDPFYTEKGGWDYQRIPLLKPYFAINTGDGWLISFPDDESVLSKGAVFANYLNVQDSIIFIRSFIKADITRAKDSTWSFIIVSSRVESVFSNEQDYLDSLKHYTDISPTYRDIESVWEQFSKTGYLEWFPEEYKPKK